jgi:copper chaperone
MLTLQVDDMSCGHCVRAIKDAVRGIDAEAGVDVDLARHVVRVQSNRFDAPRVLDALTQAGYSPVIVAEAVVPAQPSSCCGCVGLRCGCGG